MLRPGAQGEYVAVSRLETIYQANSKAIHQIYIYGNSLRSHLLAVVVPALGARPTPDPSIAKQSSLSIPQTGKPGPAFHPQQRLFWCSVYSMGMVGWFHENIPYIDSILYITCANSDENCTHAHACRARAGGGPGQAEGEAAHGAGQRRAAQGAAGADYPARGAMKKKCGARWPHFLVSISVKNLLLVCCCPRTPAAKHLLAHDQHVVYAAASGGPQCPAEVPGCQCTGEQMLPWCTPRSHGVTESGGRMQVRPAAGGAVH